MLPIIKSDGAFWILQDLLTGGNMGIKEEKRILNAYEFTRQVLLRRKTPCQYIFYMLKHKLRSAWCQIFPTRDELAILYPAMQTLGFLYPVFRVHRMFAYPLNKIRNGVLKDQVHTNTSQLPQEAQQRMDMFKALDMLP